MPDTQFKNAILVAKEAAKQGAAQMREMLGKTNDPDLMIYNKLKDEDFQQILQDKGPDELQRYIATMEAKRTNKGG